MKNEVEAATVRYIKKCREQVPHRNVIKTKEFLKENKLKAVPMDKSNGYCIMPNATYDAKMKDLLKLKQFKKLVQRRKNAMEPSLSVEEKINASLLKLKKNGKISEELYKGLHSTGGTAPRLYGMAKTHKPTIPLRPVLSMCGSAYSKIAFRLAK